VAVQLYRRVLPRAICVQQLERISYNLEKRGSYRIPLFAGILQILEASGKLLRFSYKEEVSGSNPGRSIRKTLCFAGKT